MVISPQDSSGLGERLLGAAAGLSSSLAGLCATRICRWCHGAPCTPKHRYYCCPALDALRQEYLEQSIIGWEGKDIVANSSEIVYEGKLKVRHPK